MDVHIPIKDFKFICSRCGHGFDLKANLTAHLQNKTPCQAKLQDISRDVLLEQFKNPTPKNPQVECMYCKKLVGKVNISRHMKTCKERPLQVIQQEEISNDEETKASSTCNDRQVIQELRQLVKLLTEENKRLNNSQVKVVLNLNGQTIYNKDNKKYKKKNIPHTVKINCWNTHVGELVPKTKCLCCKNVDITQHNFHCGHIIAESNGGTYKMDNLLPICNVCNSSMGSTNMNEFKKMYGFV